MAKVYRLVNKIKYYEWGAPQTLPEFLGLENRENLPWAEMWMGTHPGAPSQAHSAETSGGLVNLAQLAGELPFLFKLLAVEKPLSVQAHPNKAQAEEGFRRENEAGIALDAPERNYRDANHKPEMLCAITPFTLMAGFREPLQILSLFEELATSAPLGETLTPLLRALQTPPANPLENFFRALFELSKNERETICKFLCETGGANGNETGGRISLYQWELMRDFAAQYSGDAALLSPLYLNLFTLEAGQAVFIPSGILHSYVSGFAAELMANSDNVLRGGLTPKHVDPGELIKILKFNPFMPEIFAAPASKSWFRYSELCEDFSLSFMRGGGKEVFPETRPAICIVTEGELHAGGDVFKKGESLFVHSEGVNGAVVFDGNYSLFAAAAGAAAQAP